LPASPKADGPGRRRQPLDAQPADQPDGKKLYVAIGSSSNIGENGPDAELGRAMIYEIDLTDGSHRQFAAGLRNANGMGWNPSTGELWAVVNERDQLGPDLVPDYLVERAGGHALRLAVVLLGQERG
jgi:glucose/arabinose dehydrogenase